MHTTGGQGVITNSAYQNLPTYGFHALQRFTKRNPWILPIFSVRTSRTRHVPDSFNHSPCLIKLSNSSYPEGDVGPYGSISLSTSPLHLPPPPPPSTTTTTTTTSTTTTRTHSEVLRTICTTFHIVFMFFATFLINIYIYMIFLLKCYHESSRTPQHSEWNCVGANRPQHMHMCSLAACDRTLNAQKIRIVQNKIIFATTKIEFESEN